MKTKQISGGKKEIILVILENKEPLIYTVRDFERLEEGCFLGFLYEITEDQAAELVSSIERSVNGERVTVYMSYPERIFCKRNALDSLNSLLERNGVLFENPYMDAVLPGDWNSDDEPNVFRPESTLVFVKE